MKNQFALQNIHCVSCVSKIESISLAVCGVDAATVNFAAKQLTIEGEVDVMAIVDALQKAGYEAELIQDAHAHHHASNIAAQRFWQALVAGIVGLPLMLNLFLHFFPVFPQHLGVWWVVAVIVLITMIYSGGHIYKGCWQSIRYMSLNMDTLVGLGTGAAFLYSVFILSAHAHLPTMSQQLYFDVTPMLLAFITLGNGLEARAQRHSNQAIEQLIQSQPKTTTVIIDGQDQVKPIADIEGGMLCRLLPGEQVAVDGIVIEGESTLDESMLTGESRAIHKVVGDKVFAGTVNQSGSVLYRATAVGSESTLGRLISLVEAAQNSKPAVARLVDKVAGVFVPIVLLIAVITGLVWFLYGPEPKIGFVLTTVISVLVIACPCALGLATPISLTIAIGRAAKMGLLIRDGNGLQQLSKVDTVIFDKTGTLTQGKPIVTDVISFKGKVADWLPAVVAIEQRSEHPLAGAIVQYGKQSANHMVQDFEATPGGGVTATVDGTRYAIGRLDWLESQGVVIQREVPDATVYVARNKVLVGCFTIEDALREDAASTVAALKSQAKSVRMVTGDRESIAKTVAEACGIDHIQAEVKPHDKQSIVASLQQEGHAVLMVGDGLNDAAALAAADVSIAMGQGADVSLEVADMAILSSRLMTIVEGIALSCLTLRNIKQNLLGAFLYNALSIPIAAGILYPWLHVLLNPIIAGAAMALSSLTVVFNANRLRYM